MELTANESAALKRTAARLDDLRSFLQTNHQPTSEISPPLWFAYLFEIKSILGNFSNDLSLVSCLMAKDYLSTRLSLAPFDVALKPQGANGLDIDEYTLDGERVIGEIKTTSPCKKTKFGAAQITALRKDFSKLQMTEAAHKFMFVTDVSAFEALKRDFAVELSGTTIVCLNSGEEFAV